MRTLDDVWEAWGQRAMARRAEVRGEGEPGAFGAGAGPRGAAAEVVELGETLFDAVIGAAVGRRGDEGAEELFPEAEVRAAAGEFFRALRVLLGVEGVDGA